MNNNKLRMILNDVKLELVQNIKESKFNLNEQGKINLGCLISSCIDNTEATIWVCKLHAISDSYTNYVVEYLNNSGVLEKKHISNYMEKFFICLDLLINIPEGVTFSDASIIESYLINWFTIKEVYVSIDSVNLNYIYYKQYFYN